MILHIANTIENAIKIDVKIYGNSEAEFTINNHIDRLFGGTDGDYFIMNSMERTHNDGRKFKIVLVEDRDKVKHQVYFHMNQTEPITTRMGY